MLLPLVATTVESPAASSVSYSPSLSSFLHPFAIYLPWIPLSPPTRRNNRTSSEIHPSEAGAQVGLRWKQGLYSANLSAITVLFTSHQPWPWFLVHNVPFIHAVHTVGVQGIVRICQKKGIFLGAEYFLTQMRSRAFFFQDLAWRTSYS